MPRGCVHEVLQLCWLLISSLSRSLRMKKYNWIMSSLMGLFNWSHHTFNNTLMDLCYRKLEKSALDWQECDKLSSFLVYNRLQSMQSSVRLFFSFFNFLFVSFFLLWSLEWIFNSYFESSPEGRDYFHNTTVEIWQHINTEFRELDVNSCNPSTLTHFIH